MQKSFLCKLILLFIMFFSTTIYAGPDFAERSDVQAFIKHMVKKYDFKTEDLEKLFSQVNIRTQVIQHVQKPLESKPWYAYQALFITEWRINHGVKFWHKYEAALREAEKRYGVPASIIVATIGVESKYGERIGDYRVIDSLTNLAFSNSRRAPYFRSELQEFLLLTREEGLNPLTVMGSYAGAIGQPQFMPSSYRYYAVNFSNSGKTDLMYNEVDVIGSIANYYKKHGWKNDQPVSVQASLMGDRFHYYMENDKIKQPLTVAELEKYGMVPKWEGYPDNLKVKILELEERYYNQYWLTFHNFDVIKRYNASALYAMAVYQLSNYINAAKERADHGQTK
jgi:membrane-bound lytic murein transglycosylase B